MISMDTIEQLLMIKAIWVVVSAAIFAGGLALFFRLSRRTPNGSDDNPR